MAIVKQLQILMFPEEFRMSRMGDETSSQPASHQATVPAPSPSSCYHFATIRSMLPRPCGGEREEDEEVLLMVRKNAKNHHQHARRDEEAEEELVEEQEDSEDPLVAAVERAVEEALEMLLRDEDDDDEGVGIGDGSDQDSITTACRVEAEQSLRDELARADSAFLASSYYYYHHHHHHHHRCDEHFRSNPVREGSMYQSSARQHHRSVEDQDDKQECWWLEVKQDSSVAETSITEATSSWSFDSPGERSPASTATTNEPIDRSFGHDRVPPYLYWNNLVRGIVTTHGDENNHGVGPPQMIDLVIACNLLAVAWEAKIQRPSSTLLWRSWKQQLGGNVDVAVWTRLANNRNSHTDASLVIILAVPLLGGATAVRRSRTRRRWAFGFLTDTWTRYLTNRLDNFELEEIE